MTAMMLFDCVQLCCVLFIIGALHKQDAYSKRPSDE